MRRTLWLAVFAAALCGQIKNGPAVGDGVPEARAMAHYVTRHPGGHGAIREVIELILHTQAKWESYVTHYTE